MTLRTLRNRTFWTGVIVGVALVFLVRVAINESTIPDHLVAPLLMADSSARADAIVVLGAGVVANCVPNLNGMRRALLGARLFREQRAPMLFITGGAGEANCPVSDAMAQVARDYGVPADRLMLERQSDNTHENGTLSAPMLRERRVGRILLVTDRLHMRRAAGVFAQQGFAVEPVSVPIYEGHVDNVSMLSGGIREAIALAYYRLRGWTARRSGKPETPARAGADSRGALGETMEPVSVQTTGSSGRRPVVILGASYAAGWKMPDLDGIPVVNAGVAGQQSFEMLARFESDVTAVRPRAVVLWGFINDFFRADDPAKAHARVLQSYTEMVTRARAQGIDPILVTEVTIRAPSSLTESVTGLIASVLGRQSYQDRINRQVIETNRWVRELGQREKLLVLDFQTALGDARGGRRREFATEDGSHISPHGYATLTEYARPILARRLKAAAAAPAVNK